MTTLCRRGCLARNGRDPKLHQKANECPFWRADHPDAPSPSATLPVADPATAPSAPLVAVPPKDAATPPGGRLGKRRLMTFFRREEGEPRPKDAVPPEPDYVVDDEHAARWVQTWINWAHSGMEWFSESINVPAPRKEAFQLRELEKDELGDLAKEGVTKLMKSMGFRTRERAHHFIDSTAFASAMFGIVKETGLWATRTHAILVERKAQGKTWAGKTLTPEQIEARAKKRTIGTALAARLRLRRAAREKEPEKDSGEVPP